MKVYSRESAFQICSRYDCILPLLKDSSGSSKYLILNLSDENVHVLKTTCATLNDEVDVPSSSIESHAESIPCSQDFSVAETTIMFQQQCSVRLQQLQGRMRVYNKTLAMTGVVYQVVSVALQTPIMV